MTDPLFDAGDVTALGKMVAPIESVPEPKAEETPAPAATETPAPPPAAKAEESAVVDTLSEMLAANKAALEEMTQAIVERERAAGDTRPTRTIVDEFTDEEPALKALAQAVHDTKAQLDRIEARQAEADQRAELEANQKATIERWTAQHNELRSRFPGLTDQDMDRVWEWAEKHPAEAAVRTVATMAEEILSYGYLDQRRSPVGKPPASLPPPPAVPTAKLVTDAAAGSGGAPRASQPPRSSGGDVRDAFNEIRSDPAALASLGKYGG